jgi:signal transduction histidine kinase/HAMP domain-containing protein
MKNKLIYSLLALFILFLAGSSLTMVYLYKTTSNLESVINLHRVEIIRQDLVISAQTVQSHLYSFGSAFGQEVDVIVDNVLELDSAANRCLGCHHTREITDKLREVSSLVQQYQDALSHLMTTSANSERIERLRMVAIGIGTTLLQKSQEMAFIAGEKLKDKTVTSIQEINNSRIILIITLVLSFFIALAVAVGMTRHLTEPIDELVDATRRIKAGELGYVTHFKASGEFGELITSFNEMSGSLQESNQRVLRHINGLSNLYAVTLSFHAITNREEIIHEVAYGVANLIGAEQCGLMLLDGDEFVHMTPAVGLDRHQAGTLRIPRGKIEGIAASGSRRALILNGDIENSPFAEADRKLHIRNLMFVWIKHKGDLKGIIRVANKHAGPFAEEDAHPLAILANNVSVALENARLYDSLLSQMEELRSTQEQLVQAAKLVAIGELASHVAHEINNPLTSILGYAELIREETESQRILGDISVIETESLRAKEIVHQLLEFSRKRPLQVRATGLNELLDGVIELVALQIRDSAAVIKKDFGSIPPIEGDPNQLKQVFINIINNAIYAIKGEGTIEVATYLRHGEVHVRITDTGEGIPRENLGRIFEPFFSTKKEKGTGIGLSVSYSIVQNHQGRLDVQSELGRGTTFTVVLPIHRIPLAEPETSGTNA